MYKKLVRPLLFNFDPEKVHHLATGFLKTLFSVPVINSAVKNYATVKDKRHEKE
jgi:dihydroorotate dehydrogenase